MLKSNAKDTNMKKLLILLLFPLVVLGSTEEKILLEKQELPAFEKVEILYVVSAGKGYSIQSEYDCPSGCASTLKFFASANNESYEQITDLDTSVSSTENVLLIASNAYFKYLRIEIENTGATPFNIKVIGNLKQE